MNSKKIKISIGIALVVATVTLTVLFSGEILGAFAKVIRLFLPFILGFAFSFLAKPLADVFEKRFKLPRNISAILVILICLGIIGGLLAALISRIIDEIQAIYQDPTFLPNLENLVNSISSRFTGLHSKLPSDIRQALSGLGGKIVASFSELLSGDSAPIFRSAGNFAKSIPAFFIGVVVFLLSSFFMISDAEHLENEIKKRLSDKTRIRFSKMKNEIKRYIGGYVKAQLIIMSVVFVILLIGLSILNIKYSLLIAAVTAVFDALPFFGSGAVLITWAVISLFTSQIPRAVGLIIIYLCVIFTRQMIEPKIVSYKIGMNPLLTLMAMYLGYRLFSIGGMILGPIVMMLIISLKRAGFFDGIIKFFGIMKRFAEKEINNAKKQLEE